MCHDHIKCIFLSILECPINDWTIISWPHKDLAFVYNILGDHIQDENFRYFLVWACLASCCYHTIAQLWSLCPVKPLATGFPDSQISQHYLKWTITNSRGMRCAICLDFFWSFFPLLQLISNPKQFFMNQLIRVFFFGNVFIGLHVHARVTKGPRWEGDCWCTIW